MNISGLALLQLLEYTCLYPIYFNVVQLVLHLFFQFSLIAFLFAFSLVISCRYSTKGEFFVINFFQYLIQTWNFLGFISHLFCTFLENVQKISCKVRKVAFLRKVFHTKLLTFWNKCLHKQTEGTPKLVASLSEAKSHSTFIWRKTFMIILKTQILHICLKMTQQQAFH